MNQSHINVINSSPLYSRRWLSFKMNEATFWPVTLEGHTAGFRSRLRSRSSGFRGRASLLSVLTLIHAAQLTHTFIWRGNTNHSSAHQLKSAFASPVRTSAAPPLIGCFTSVSHECCNSTSSPLDGVMEHQTGSESSALNTSLTSETRLESLF